MLVTHYLCKVIWTLFYFFYKKSYTNGHNFPILHPIFCFVRMSIKHIEFQEINLLTIGVLRQSKIFWTKFQKYAGSEIKDVVWQSHQS